MMPNPKRYILVSTQDADHIQKGIYRGDSEFSQASLVSFDGKVVVGVKPARDPEELKRICLQAKIASGKTNYSKAEIQLLDTLLENNKQKAADLQRVMERMLSYLPHGAQNYSNSLLRKYFKRMQET